MKKNALALVVLFSIFSCNKVTQPLTKDEINQKADSISDIRLRQADEQAKTDLEYRMKIEVKVKVDSILVARMKSPYTDTVKKNTVKKDTNNPDFLRNVKNYRDTVNKAGINSRRRISGNQDNIEVGTKK